MSNIQVPASKGKRWGVLFLAALVMMMGYVFWDIISPVSTQLKAPLAAGGMAWTAEEYGFYAGSYSIFNIFFLMLFFGGVILDKCGIRLTGLLATGAMLAGAVINCLAITRISPLVQEDLPFTLFGLIPGHVKLQVLVAALGFALFGMGCDITGITVSKIITKWFTGHELASAMGVQVAMARLGTAMALSFSPLLATHWGLSAPLVAGVAVLALAFALFIAYCFIDRSLPQAPARQADGDSFSFRDLVTVLRNKRYWMVVFLCVFYYSSIRPFMKFASDIMVQSFGVGEQTAGWIVAAIPYGAIVLSPLFGAVYDRRGHGARLMLIGCSTLTVGHLCLAFPVVRSAWFALIIMVVIGVAFSLVPAALWPTIPQIVPLKQLGTAYSITYFIQNTGLMLVPVWIGRLVDANTSDGRVDYELPMLVFAAFGLVATLLAAALAANDARLGRGESIKCC